MSPLDKDETLLDEPAEWTPPITDFECIVADINQTQQTFSDRSSRYIHFECGELVIHEQTEPYTEDTFEFRVPHSTAEQSAWNVLRTGIVKLLPEEAGKDLNWVIGQRARFVWGSFTGRRPDATGEWVEKEVGCWTITELGGQSVPETLSTEDFNEALLTLMDGKSKSDFATEFYGSDLQLANEALFNKTADQIANDQLFDTLVTAKLITIEDDVISRVAQ